MAERWRGDRLDRESVVSGPFTFPWDAPLYPPFPIAFRDVSILTVAWRTDPQAIERLLPPPLERLGDVVLRDGLDALSGTASGRRRSPIAPVF